MSVATAADLGAALRQRTPAVQRAAENGWALFDGPSGTQVIARSIEATAELARAGLTNRHGLAPQGDVIEALVERARTEMSALFHADEYEVVFGQNMTSLAFSLAHALARTLEWRDRRFAVTELDHCANIDPWLQALTGAGATADSIPVSPEAVDIDHVALEKLAATPPRLIAASAGSNAIGVVPHLGELRDFAQAHGALLVLDCVQATPHGPLSLREIAPDIAFCSAYKLYGPHLGIAFIRRALADRLAAYKVAPAPAAGAEKFETGTQNFEALAGLLGTLDGLAELSGGNGGAGARDTLHALGHGEETRADWVAKQLRTMPGVRVYRQPEPRPGSTPIVAFTVAGRRSDEVATALAQQRVAVTFGDFYATPLARRLDVLSSGGWVRVGISGYTSGEDCTQLVDAVGSVVGTAASS